MLIQVVLFGSWSKQISRMDTNWWGNVLHSDERKKEEKGVRLLGLTLRHLLYLKGGKSRGYIKVRLDGELGFLVVGYYLC